MLSAGKLALVADAVMNTCDAVDGLKDGLIDDPRACRFDPAKDIPVCTAGNDASSCLAPAQAGAIQKVYGGVVSNGKAFFPGFMSGSEALNAGSNGVTSSGWMNLPVPAKPGSRSGSRTARPWTAMVST